MVQEIHSTLDFDFVDYTDKNLTLFQNELEQFNQNSENYQFIEDTLLYTKYYYGRS